MVFCVPPVAGPAEMVVPVASGQSVQRSHSIGDLCHNSYMYEVYPNLYIGSRNDYESLVSGQPGWAIVHACKQYHRSAIGYKLWNVPRHHPEYVLARRDNRIMLCLLDLPVSR